MQDLWNRTLGEVEIEVSKAVFLTLFKQTTLMSLDQNVATVGAPSMMIIDLLQRRFYSTIKKSLDKQTGKDNKIIFVPKSFTTIINESEKGPLFEPQPINKIVVGHLPRVRADFTFENLAVSSTNQLAFASASSVAKKVGSFYNPLFIHGPVGVGKTHLMQAIANEVYLKNPNRKIVYTTSEEFTNEVVEAIRGNSTGSLKRKFRNLDLLLIDDVQFLMGKEKVQEELFHTFNILIDNSSQVVLSSDRHPSQLKGVEKRLVSRFSGGLTVDIEPPDFELRCAILLIKSKRLNAPLTVDGAKLIAQEIKDTRELEGTLLRIITQTEALGESLSVPLIERFIENKKENKTTAFSPEDLVKNICFFYKIRVAQIKSPKRDAFLVKPRQIAMYLLKKDFGLTFSQIGEILGGRDHTTIMHGVEKIEGMSSDQKTMGDLLGISRLYKNPFVD